MAGAVGWLWKAQLIIASRRRRVDHRPHQKGRSVRPPCCRHWQRLRLLQQQRRRPWRQRLPGSAGRRCCAFSRIRSPEIQIQIRDLFFLLLARPLQDLFLLPTPHPMNRARPEHQSRSDNLNVSKWDRIPLHRWGTSTARRCAPVRRPCDPKLRAAAARNERDIVIFFKNGPTLASFSFIFVFAITHYNFYNK